MSREHRKRADGTDIDPVKNLAEFVQSFPMTGEPEEQPKPQAKPAAQAQPAETPAAATAAPVETSAPVVDPEFAGKSSEEIIALAKKERERASEIERQARETRAELEAARTQRQIEETARRVVAETQPIKPYTPEPPKIDPRYQQVEDLWFSEPAKARALWKQIQDEEYEQRLNAEREKTKQEVFTTLEQRNQRSQAEFAYHSAVQELQKLGVPPSQFDANRITAVYAAITRQPTATAPNPYYTAGGPLNQNVIVQAWKDFYGVPTQTPAQAPVVQTQTPPVPAPPVAAAPPGSGRPAPAAAAPAQTRAVAIDANDKRDISHLATTFGYDPEKMLARRRARLAEGK